MCGKAAKIRLTEKQDNVLQQIRRSTTTAQRLVQRAGAILDFIDYFNRTFARPFRWTYTGRPTTAKTVKRPTTWREDWVSRRVNSENLALVG